MVVNARDFVEANADGRRRLSTAFVRGAPGGREAEPARPARTLLGGLVVAVVLLAGGRVAAFLGPRDPDVWAQPGLVVSDRTGASYLVLEAGDHPTLRPVLNNASARLALGAGGLRPRIVAQEAIDDRPIGAAVGIADAPAALPDPSRLVQTGWSACLGDRSGLRVRLAPSPTVRRLPRSGLVVVSRGVRYVVARAAAGATAAPTARAYRLPGGSRGSTDEQDALLEELGLPIRADATVVPHRWLALFPRGAPLTFRAADRLRPVRGRTCAELTTRDGAAPTVQLATDPVAGRRIKAGVAPGWGAYVRAGGWGGRARGSPFVVDARGVASPVVGPEAATRLGYGDTAAPVVPVAWLDLFERGVPLSVEAVLTGVGPAGGP